MTGDSSDIISRIKTALPTRWFSDTAPVLDALLSGLSTGWAAIYALLASVRLESRISTATDSFLDGASADFFGSRLPRRGGETDTIFRGRVLKALTREHATRGALADALLDLTGHAPTIFEPARVTDTGAYGGPTLGYGVAGAWGSLNLPFQIFVAVQRPRSAGIAYIAGYGTGGPLALASFAQVSGQVTDADIYATIISVLPTASTAWTRITN